MCILKKAFRTAPGGSLIAPDERFDAALQALTSAEPGG
jgi:hypothetical protein